MTEYENRFDEVDRIAKRIYIGMGKMTMRQIENCAIDATVLFHNNDVSRAARALGISRRTIQRRLKEAGK